MRIVAELIGALMLIGAVWLGVGAIVQHVKKSQTQQKETANAADKPTV